MIGHVANNVERVPSGLVYTIYIFFVSSTCAQALWYRYTWSHIAVSSKESLIVTNVINKVGSRADQFRFLSTGGGD